jgi:carbamoyltransferase
MIILGINAYHPNSSACLLTEGTIKIALEEERMNRIKYWSGLPIEAIKFCLKNKNLNFSDVDYIAINQDFFANIFSKINDDRSSIHNSLTRPKASPYQEVLFSKDAIETTQ